MRTPFGRLPFRSKVYADIGYQGLELMADRPHAWPEDMTPAKIESIRRALDRHHMQVSNVNASASTRLSASSVG